MNQSLTINQLINDAHQNAKAHGWHEPERTFGEIIALCHSELSEALEEYRNNAAIVDYWYGPDGKPEGIPAELADVVIRIADMCGLYGIDLEEAIRDKMAYNESRPMRHGGKVL